MSTRELAWKDTFVGKLVQDFAGDTCTGSPVLLDNDYNLIVLELTADQWTQIFSSLLEGSDLTYPDTSQEIVWWWLKGVECAMSFCARMIECFQTDEDTREAMINAFIQELLADPVLAEAFASAMAQIGVGNPSAPTSTGTPNDGILDDLLYGDCDPDTLYGKCFGAVDALNTIAEDVLQVIEVLTNDTELKAQIADNIPVLGAIPATLGEIANWLQETVTETYLSDYNVTVQEYWACKIYCLVGTGDCQLTIGSIRDAYYNELLSFSPPPLNSDLQTLLDWFIDLTTIDATETVGAMHLFLLEVLIRAGVVWGQNFRAIEIALETSVPITPPCDCCIDLLFPFDTSTEVDLIAGNAYNTVVTSWQSNTWAGGLPCLLVGETHYGNPATPSRFSFFKVILDPDCTYNTFSIEMYSEGFNASNLAIQFWTDTPVPLDGSGYFASAIDPTPNPNGYRTINGTFVGGFTPALGYVIVGVGSGGLASSGLIRVKNLTLGG